MSFRPRKNRTVRDLCFHWLPFCLLPSLMIDYDWFEATKIFDHDIFKEGERWTCWRSFTFVTRFFFVLFIKSINKYQVIPYFLPSVSSRQDIFLLFWKYVSVTLVLRACRFQSVIVRDLLSGDKKVLNFLGFQFFPDFFQTTLFIRQFSTTPVKQSMPCLGFLI